MGCYHYHCASTGRGDIFSSLTGSSEKEATNDAWPINKVAVCKILEYPYLGRVYCLFSP